MNLSNRLQAIADLVTKSSAVADIGTDHGYIPIYLIKNNIAEKVIAADISDGSLNKARELVSKYDLKDCIECRLGNGLDVLSPGEADTIIIAGMGGKLISQILKDQIQIAKSAESLILQPMNGQGELRKWLILNGFEIIDEDLVKEGNKFYEIIKAEPEKNTVLKDDVVNNRKVPIKKDLSGKKDDFEGKIDDSFGNNFDIGLRLIEKRHPLLGEFILKKMQEIEKIMKKLNNGESSMIEQRYSELKSKLEHYKELYKWI